MISLSFTIAAIIISSYTFSITLTLLSSKYRRINGATTEYYYMANPIIISKSGNHTFTTESNIATCGFLHRNSFDPENPSSNLVAQDCINGEKRQYTFSVVLEASTTVSKRVSFIAAL